MNQRVPLRPNEPGSISKVEQAPYNVYKKLLWCEALKMHVMIVFDGRELSPNTDFLDILDSVETAVLLFRSETTHDPTKAGTYRAGLLIGPIRDKVINLIDRNYISVTELYELDKLLKSSNYVHRRGFGNHENVNIGG